MIKSILVVVTEHLHWRFKNKCKFHKLTMQEVVATLISKFDEGEFDHLFNLPVNKP